MSLTAIIDIGSSSVGGALLVPHSQPSIKSRWLISYTTRQPVNFNEQLDTKVFFDQVVLALKQVLQDLAAAIKSPAIKGSGQPRAIHCFLSAPFYAAQVRVIRRQAAKAFRANEALIQELLRTEVQRFQTEQTAEHELLENQVLAIKLNGYLVPTVAGQTVNELELSAYFSLGAKAMIQRLRETIAGAFHQREIIIHTAARTNAAVGQLLQPANQDYLLFDLGGEVTELTLMRQGRIWDTASFPSGENQLLRQLASTQRTSLPEARASLLRQLAGDHHEQAAVPVATSLASARSDWLAGVTGALTELRRTTFLPTTAWLIGDPDFLPLFKEWLAHLPLANLMITNQPLSIAAWSGDDFLPWCRQAAQARADWSLMAEAVYYDKLVTGA